MAKKPSKVKIGGYSEPRSVTIKKAANGFVITTYTSTGENIEVAKDMEEAGKIAKRILGK